MRKLTLLINSLSSLPAGWSETMYTTTTGDNGVNALAQAWMEARSQLLSKDYQIIGCRISSNITAPPITSRMYVPPADIIGKDTRAGDYPNTAVLVSLLALGASESRSLRGWADEACERLTGATKVQLTDTGRARLLTYSNFIGAQPLGWLRAKKKGDAGFISAQPTSVTVDPDSGNPTLVGAYPAGMTAPNEGIIVVTGFKAGLRSLSGTYSPANYSLSNTTLVLPRVVSPAAGAAYISKTALVALKEVTFASAISVEYIRVSSHKTGRPFGSLRGRR